MSRFRAVLAHIGAKQRARPPIAPKETDRESVCLSAVREAFRDAAYEASHGRSPEREKTYTAWPVSKPTKVTRQAENGWDGRAHKKEFPVQSSLATDSEFAAIYRAALSIAREQVRDRCVPKELAGASYFGRGQKKPCVSDGAAHRTEPRGATASWRTRRAAAAASIQARIAWRAAKGSPDCDAYVKTIPGIDERPIHR